MTRVSRELQRRAWALLWLRLAIEESALGPPEELLDDEDQHDEAGCEAWRRALDSVTRKARRHAGEDAIKALLSGNGDQP